MTNAQERYQLYLQSEHWTGLRLEAFRQYGRKCSRCPLTHSLEVHHVRYRYPWESCTVGDVVILCHWCHRLEHAPVVRVVPDSVRHAAQKKRKRRGRGHWQRAAAKHSAFLDRYISKRRRRKLRKAVKSVYHYTKPWSKHPRYVNRGNSSN